MHARRIAGPAAPAFAAVRRRVAWKRSERAIQDRILYNKRSKDAFPAFKRGVKYPRPSATKTAPSHIPRAGGAGIAPWEWRRAVTLIEKIPSLSDEEVLNLLANAQRLSTEGDEKQQLQASELIEPLQQAAAERRAARLAATQAKRAARRPRKSAA